MVDYNDLLIKRPEQYHLYLDSLKQTKVEQDSGTEFRALLMDKIQTAMLLNNRSTNISFISSPFNFNRNDGAGNPYLSAFQQLNQPVQASLFSPQTNLQTNSLVNNFANQVAQTYQKAQSSQTVNQTNSSNKAPASPFNDIIRRAAAKYGVDELLIHSIIKHESNYNPKVVSHAGAVGLMQLMPVTAKEVGVTDRYDNEQNIMGATHYFSKMLKRHNGDLRLALASYNAGPGNVQKYGGIPPFKETQNYVRNVSNYYYQLKA